MFRFINSNFKHLISFFILVTLPYGCLLISYFAFGEPPGILLLILPVYAQIKLSNVLNASFKKLDEYIADEIVKTSTIQEDAERIKAFIDLRESLTKSIKFSTQEFIIPTSKL